MSKKIAAAFILLTAGIVILWILILFVRNNGVEEAKVYQIGLLQMSTPVNPNIEGFKAGMEELGYVEGKNVQYTYLNAEGDTQKVIQYAKDLVAMNPDLIFTNTSPATKAAKEATQDTDIPVVFSMVADPLGAGFVQSIKSSGNNLTGTSCAYIEIAAKRLEVLKEIDPKIKKVLIYYRPEDKSGGPATTKIQEVAPKLGVEIVAQSVNTVDEIKKHLETLKPGDADAIMDPADSMINSAAKELIDISIKLKIPLFMLTGQEPEMGALAGYGVDYFDLGKQNAPLANKILKGIARPSQIPIEMPRKFMFIINMATAEKIGLSFPPSVLAKVDKIIK